MSITIYHNPSCGTSRNTLAMIRQSGENPEVIEYLKAPPTRERLIELLRAMNMSPRELLRRKDTPYDELGLDDPKWTDHELITLMLEHPILINRPIVVTPNGVRLCRPSEVVLEILPNPEIGVFTKEDGEVIAARKAGAAWLVGPSILEKKRVGAVNRQAPYVGRTWFAVYSEEHNQEAAGPLKASRPSGGNWRCCLGVQIAVACCWASAAPWD